jgi:hypothetical protein
LYGVTAGISVLERKMGRTGLLLGLLAAVVQLVIAYFSIKLLKNIRLPNLFFSG